MVVVVAVEGEILDGEVVGSFDPGVGGIVGVRHAEGGQLAPGAAQGDVRRDHQLLADDETAPRYQHDSSPAFASLFERRLDGRGVVLLVVPGGPESGHVEQGLVLLVFPVKDRDVERFAPALLAAVAVVHEQLVAARGQLFRHRHRQGERLGFLRLQQRHAPVIGAEGDGRLPLTQLQTAPDDAQAAPGMDGAVLEAPLAERGAVGDGVAERPPGHRQVDAPGARGSGSGMQGVEEHALLIRGQLEHQGGLARLQRLHRFGQVPVRGELPGPARRLAGFLVRKPLQRNLQVVGLREKAAHHDGLPGLNRGRDPVDRGIFRERRGTGQGGGDNG